MAKLEEGLNLWQRFATAFIGIPLLLFAVYFGEWSFLLICFLASALALYEFHGLTKGLGKDISLPLLEIGGLIAFVFTYLIGLDKLNGASLIVLIIFILILEMFRSRAALTNGALTILGIIYSGVIFAFLPLLRDIGRGPIILLFLITWGTDSFAFFVGIKFGKHKLWPEVSPKKTWEGALGGVLGGLAGGLVTSLFGLCSLPDGLLAGLLGSILAQTGDLMESVMKRESKVKDAGYILPGHGGILDRFDSLLLLAPTLYLIIQHLLPSLR